jgi:N utilization substance protein B
VVTASRRAARERALSLLYEADTKGLPPADVLAGLPVAPDPFVADLVAGVGDHLPDLDGLIAGRARDWPLDRMPLVDKNLLRMATFELRERPQTPVAVVISEAVELAKQYSTDDSGRFVNGVLSALAADLRPSA